MSNLKETFIKAIINHPMTDQLIPSIVFYDSDFEEVYSDMGLELIELADDIIIFGRANESIRFSCIELTNRHGDNLPDETLVFLDDNSKDEDYKFVMGTY